MRWNRIYFKQHKNSDRERLKDNIYIYTSVKTENEYLQDTISTIRIIIIRVISIASEAS